MKIFLGIDPGLGGALATYQKTESGVLIYAEDMPTFEITVNGKKKRQIDLYKLAGLFNNNFQIADHAFIEDPHALPGQGVTSSFNFGASCGVAQMAVASCGIPMTLVRPAIWKKALSLTADKDACRRRASQLFPRYASLFSRSKDDGRAEATLLAYYGSLAHGNRRI